MIIMITMKRSFKNTMLKLMTIIIAIAILSSFIIIPTIATENSEANEKIIYTPSPEAQYSNDRILVIMTQNASLQFNNYTVSSFSEISCKDVHSLTSSIDEVAKAAITSGIESIGLGKAPTIVNNLDLEGYQTMLCLELNEPSKENVEEAIKDLQMRSDVYCVCPDYYLRFVEPAVSTSTANVVRNSSEYTDPEEIFDLIGLSSITNMLENGQLSYDYENDIPIVAVIDSGITHETLNNNIHSNMCADFTNYNGILQPDDDYPYTNSIDDKGHGTHVAGIIKSVVDYNDYNINIKIAELKVSSDTDDIYDISAARVISAINYAQGWGIPLINISGMTAISPSGIELSVAFRTAVSGYQGLIICSAGNDARYLETEDEDDDATNYDYYPASLIMDNIITVGSCDLNSEISYFSNWGKSNVDIFAPGEAVFSTFSTYCCNAGTCESASGYENSHIDIDIDNDGVFDNGYHYLSGTSQAAPLVTGVAAMMLAFNPELDSDTIKYIILEESEKYDNLKNLCTSGGRLNAFEAIRALKNFCPHNNLEYVYENTREHNVYCSICNHNYSESHKLYVYSDNGESGVTIKCSACTYTYTCTDGVAEYGYSDTNGHNVSCTCGCYSFNEPHSATYTHTSDLFSHNAYCADCGTTYSDAHTWVEISNGYKCIKCLMVSDIIPEIMSLSDEELSLMLANLTDDELEALILTLNEADRGRVAALLPVREDDFVSE